MKLLVRFAQKCGHHHRQQSASARSHILLQNSASANFSIINVRNAHDALGKHVPASPSKSVINDVVDGPANTHFSVNKRIGIIGTPSYLGQRRRGVADATRLLRQNGDLAAALRLIGYDVKDYGDVEIQQVANDTPWLDNKESKSRQKYGAPLLNARTSGLMNQRTAQLIEQIVGRDRRAVLHLGGDHATAVGSVAGHAFAQQVLRQQNNNAPPVDESSLAVLWVDAHADANTPTTSYTGNLHGMPVGFLLKELVNYLPIAIGDVPGFEWLTQRNNGVPPLSARNIAFIGLRSVDPAERLVLEMFGIKHFGMQHLDRYGIHRCVEEALSHINPSGRLPLHCSFDIDVLDPIEAPSTGYQEPGGMTLREALTLCEILHESGTLAGFDMVEINPELGTEAERTRTVKAGVQLMRAAFGYPRHCVYMEEPKALEDIESGGGGDSANAAAAEERRSATSA